MLVTSNFYKSKIRKNPSVRPTLPRWVKQLNHYKFGWMIAFSAYFLLSFQKQGLIWKGREWKRQWVANKFVLGGNLQFLFVNKNCMHNFITGRDKRKKYNAMTKGSAWASLGRMWNDLKNETGVRLSIHPPWQIFRWK